MQKINKLRVLNKIIEDESLMMTDKILFTYLLTVCNSDLVIRYWSINDLAKSTKISRTAIIKSLNKLEKNGFLVANKTQGEITEYRVSRLEEFI